MNTEYLTNSVLVVDDESFVLRTTAAVLDRLGFASVLTAETVEDALQHIASAEPPVRLVMCDLNMPDVDGLELLRLFDEKGYNSDILIFSGEDTQTLKMAENLARARNLSVIGAIAKPIQPDRLAELLSNDSNQAPSAPKRVNKTVVTPEMLESAIDAGELQPWFQPKVDIASREPVGVEALARWPNSAQGPIFPDTFIPVAEDNGLIDRLTFALVKKAFRIEQEWREQGVDLKIAVNLSMDSLYDENFPGRLYEHIEEVGGNVSNLQLEVTESRLMSDLVRPLEALLRLRMKKTKLSIDDFGTGHSNLNQLRDLPFDELKLDRSYIQAAANKERSAAILESSVEMAKKLGMTVVAEGVETLDDWKRLEQLGCDQVQGYFIARPMPGNEIPAWVASWPEQSKALLGS